MGMAASQARLLTLTARIHDVEYQAQAIQSAKLQLATQEDQVYREYLEALDATTLTVKDWQGNKIQANFNNLCGINAVDVPLSNKGQYRFFDTNGALIVDTAVAKAYSEFRSEGGNDAYSFAMYMLSNDSDMIAEDKYEFLEDELNLCSDDFKNSQEYKELYEFLTDDANGIGYEIDEDGDISFEDPDIYDAYEEWDDSTRNKFNKLVDAYRSKFYANSDNVLNMIADSYDTDTESLPEGDKQKFDYYVRQFKEIQACGGNCVTIDSFDGKFGGPAATNSEWLQDMIKAGKILVDISEMDQSGNISFRSTGVPSDSILEYTTTTTIDSSAEKKAEAEYEHKMKQIDRKDKRFDMDLNKLETERSALTKEYDSVKKVAEDNIERTFGIFS